MDEYQKVTPDVLDSINGAEDVRFALKNLAADLVTAVRKKDPEHSQELISGFVSELFMSATQQSLQEVRKKQQAKGIAQAKANGVLLGRPKKPLPENFDEVYRLLCSAQLSQKEAAKMCGMPLSTFRYKLSVYKKEQLDID